jgi:hypothetical protein
VKKPKTVATVSQVVRGIDNTTAGFRQRTDRRPRAFRFNEPFAQVFAPITDLIGAPALTPFRLEVRCAPRGASGYLFTPSLYPNIMPIYGCHAAGSLSH